MEPKNITLPSGQVISTQDPNYAEYARTYPQSQEPTIIQDQNADVVSGSGKVNAQADQLKKDYNDVITSTATEVDPLAELRAQSQGIGTTTSEEEQRIKQAGIDAGRKYDTLIGQAQREKGKGLGISEVSAGEAGGFMNTQFVGASAEPGFGAERAMVAGRYGTGGELARIKSEYDANISSLETQKLSAIKQAEDSMRNFIRTGKQADFDNAYTMFKAAQEASKAKTDAANALADRMLSINKYQLELDKFDYEQFRDEQKDYLDSLKLEVDIAGLTGDWNGAPTLAAKKQIADQAYQQFGANLEQAKFDEMVRNNSFNRELENLKFEFEKSKLESEKNGEDPNGTAEMVMNGLISYDEAKKNLKYGKAAFDKALAGYKQLNQEAYKETGNDYYKIKNSVDGKTPTNTTVEMVSKMNMAADLLVDLKGEWQNAVDKNKVGVVVGNLKKKDFTDADILTVKRQLQGLIPTIARGVFGEVGVLTDNDIKQYRGAVLNIGDPVEAQKRIFENLLDVIESKFTGTLRSSADGGYNVSGYADNYKEFLNEINGIRVYPKDQIYSSNPAVYNSIDEFRSMIGEEKYGTWAEQAAEDMTAAGITDPNTYFEALKEISLNKNLYKDLPSPETTITQDFNNVDTDTNQGGEIGSLSQKYESGGDPGAIGYDNTGGYSYGTYQLAHNNAKSFIDKSQYADDFKGLTFNSPEWQAKWKEIAINDPDGFKNSQQAYISNTHYVPQLSKIVNSGIDVSKFSPVLQDVIWSTAVQHGPNTDVIVKAYNDAKKKLGRIPSDAEFITQIYNERATRFPSSTPQIQVSVKNRFKNELNQALSMLA